MARVSFTLRSDGADQGSYLGGPPPVPPPPSLLSSEAIGWWDAASSTESFIPNLGAGGSALNASAGATAPTLLEHNGVNYVYLPGTVGNYLSLDYTDVPTLTTEFELVAQVTLDDWSPSSVQTFVGKADGPTGFSYAFNLATDGSLQVVLSPDGTTASAVTLSSVDPVTFADGDTGWVKVIWTNEFGVANFYESTDNLNWVLIGTSVNTFNIDGSVYDNIVDLSIGAIDAGATNPLKGKVHRIILRTTVNGVADFDFSPEFDVVDASSSTIVTSQDSLDVTVHSATSGLKTTQVQRPLWLFGTDATLTVPDNALLNFGNDEAFTFMVVYRETATSPSYARLLSKTDGAYPAAGYDIANNGTLEGTNFLSISDGVNAPATAAITAPTAPYGTLGTWAFLRDATDLWFNVGGTASTKVTDTSGDLTSTSDLVIGGASYVAGGYRDMALAAVAFWDRVLTADEVKSLDDYYQATEGLGRVDFDWMLRADNLILAPDSGFNGLVDFGGETNPLNGVFVGTGPGGSLGGGGSSSNIANREGSYFAAGSHCYGEVDLIWGVEGLPRTALSPPLGLTPVPTETLLVYSDQGEPQTIASGDILAEGKTVFTYKHTGLPEGRWAYYSLFVHLQAGDGTEYYERGASIAVLIPRNYGSTLQLWRRIPEYYRFQDVAIGDTNYPECLGVEDIGPIGPLFKYLSIIGFDMDRMRTILDYTMASRDPDISHTEILDTLAEQMGTIMRSSDLGPARLRRLLGDIGDYRRTKGTADAVAFLGQAIAGGDVDVDRYTGEVKVYSTRTNYVADPVDATGLIAHRPAGNVEVTAPEEFSSTTYEAYTDTYTVTGTDYKPTGTGASVGVECVMIRLLQDVYVTSGDRLCISVHSNVGTDAIKWARAYSDDTELRDANGDLLTVGISLGTLELTDDSGTMLTDDADVETFLDESYFDEEALTAPTTAAISGISFSPLKADGARAFEVEVQTTAPNSFERCGVEFLVDLRELIGDEGEIGKFVLKNLLLEKNYLGSYFDGDTVRGGWLVDTSSISDYRWKGEPFNSPSIYAEEYVRTSGVLQSLLIESAVPINVAPYFSISNYSAVSGVD